MLLELHIQNFALIAEADLEFREGLNVLSGETGAGKSILIDSISAALGEKTGKDLIRTGADEAYIELVFQVFDPEKLEKIRDLDLSPESDGVVIVSRRIMPKRSVFRVNDRTVTAGTIRELASLLIDIHGQHEVQTLFDPAVHLGFLDLMGEESLRLEKENYLSGYRRYAKLNGGLKREPDERIRAREMEILDYEIREIEEAQIQEGEEEALRRVFTRNRNAQRIQHALSEAEAILSGDFVSGALRKISEVEHYAPELSALKEQLMNLESLTDDVCRDIRTQAEETECDEEKLQAVTERLNLVCQIKEKYRAEVPELFQILEEKRDRLEYLKEFEENREAMQKEADALKTTLRESAERLSIFRKESAHALEEKVIHELKSLHFPGASFSVVFKERPSLTEQGIDDAEFYISANPGEPKKPLKVVASGGELSRIMLALKTVFAAQDKTDSLIFDEIDAGISGRSAQSVSEKLYKIGCVRQVLCITHLPQIAAMADHHYLIEKESDDGRTKTRIREIFEDDIFRELGRLIAGSVITDGVIQTAKEMKHLANETKHSET